jgi:DNA-binding IclR family transcriptional regulator
MANVYREDLEGNTLSVYTFVVKAGKPVGPREVMRGANLSSPSTAHRQLEKLESLGLIEKNVYGTYVVKDKTNISGHVWIGRNLVPRLICYSFFFFGILIAEIAILVAQFFSQGLTPSLAVGYLVPITAGATGLFLAEGLILWRYNKRAVLKTENSQD